jgi:hypothetical protein
MKKLVVVLLFATQAASCTLVKNTAKKTSYDKKELAKNNAAIINAVIQTVLFVIQKL